MADSKTIRFDPYHKWLGIPSDQQPADHYRLLGVKTFEGDLEVIASAADRQMSHLKTFAGGKYADASQNLLNEVARARLCLLNPHKKAKYDQELRLKLAATKPTAQENASTKVGQPKPPPVSESYPQQIGDVPHIRTNHVSTKRAAVSRKRRRKILPWLLLGIFFVGSGLVILELKLARDRDVSLLSEGDSSALGLNRDSMNKDRTDQKTTDPEGGPQTSLYVNAEAVDMAILDGLKWIVDQQDVDGRWNLNKTNPHTGGPHEQPVAATALALLALQGHGVDGHGDGPLHQAVAQGHVALLKMKLEADQDTDLRASFYGGVGPEAYSEALLDLAVCDLLALVNTYPESITEQLQNQQVDLSLREFAEQRLHRALQTQFQDLEKDSVNFGGWGYSNEWHIVIRKALPAID